jgi:hypothetical protein
VIGNCTSGEGTGAAEKRRGRIEDWEEGKVLTVF